MYHYRQVIHGLVRFVDDELVPKMHGLNKWLFGTAAGIVASKGERVFHALREIELMHTLDIIEGENINVDCIYKELIRQAEKGEIVIEIPMIGDIKLDHKDVEKLYKFIIEG